MADDAPEARSFYVYWIRNAQRHYVGATVDPARRLRQHNGEIKGGARRTGRAQGGWRFERVVSGFRTWREALQFEWALKYECRGCRTLATRNAALATLLARERWTSNAPPAAEVPLCVEERPTQYGEPSLEATTVVDSTESQGAPRSARSAPRKKRTQWKRTLLGVRD